MTLSFTVKLEGKPLRRTYVSQFELFRLPQTIFAMTDEAGQVTIDNANGPTKVRIHAQNAVVRVLDGGLPIPVEVSQEFTVSNGGTININTAAEQRGHFRVMDDCLDAYDTVFRQFRPFNRSSRGAFPFGKAATIAETRNRLPRIEVSFPDNSVAPLSWVEPASLGTGYPLLHLKADHVLGIPHELAHALYFALMSGPLRTAVEAQYFLWLAGAFAAGHPTNHDTTLVTNPFVAWIEAQAKFGQRFFKFAKSNPTLAGATLRQAFINAELSGGGGAPATLDAQGKVVPKPGFTGDNVEGAVYGAVYVDLARRVGLQSAVGEVFDSVEGNVLRFDEFRNWIINQTDHDDAIGLVAQTWQL